MKDIIKQKKIKKRKKLKRLSYSITAYFIFLFIAFYFYPFKETAKLSGIQPGERLKNDIVAPYSFVVSKTKEELDEEKQKIIETTPPVFVRDTTVYERILNSLESSILPEDVKKISKRFLRRIYRKGIVATRSYLYSDSVLLYERGKLTTVKTAEILGLEDVYSLARKDAFSAFRKDTLKQKAFLDFVNRVVKPNMIFDSLRTDSLRQARINEINPILAKVYKGEVIGKRGEVVTPEMVKKIDALRGTRKKYFTGNLWKYWWLRLIYFSIILIFGFVYFYRMHPEYYFSISKITVFTISYILPLVVASVSFGQNISFFITLLPFSGLLIATIMEEKSAFVFSLFLALIISIYAGENVSILIYNLVVGVTAAMTAKIIKGRFDIYLSMFFTLIGALLLSLIINYNLNDNFSGIRITLEASGASILFSYLLFIGVLPILERIFKIGTDFLLAELSNMNHPLLRELQEKAPGTMTHSLIVGNLAAQAARAIGVNPILARVAGYYHDIGKMKHPAYFIENQREGENPHDKLSPKMSVLILEDHVRDGVELAKQYRLPKEIIGVVETHHGTTLMKAFYNKAKSGGQEVKEEDFRYRGPKPRTKLEAIMMIADSIEAAARSLKDRSDENLKDLIHNIIYNRLLDGQFDEADITNKELKMVEESIFPYVKSIFHPRIEYGEEQGSSKEPKS